MNIFQMIVLKTNPAMDFLLKIKPVLRRAGRVLPPGISTYEETRQILGELEFLDPELLEDEFEGNQFGKRLTFHPPLIGSGREWLFFEGEKLAMLEFSGELYANFENVSESIAPPTTVIVLRISRGNFILCHRTVIGCLIRHRRRECKTPQHE